MLVRLPTPYNNQDLLPKSFIEAGDNLQGRSTSDQPHTKRRDQGKYNSAYSIGFWLFAYPSRMMCDVMHVCYVMLFN